MSDSMDGLRQALDQQYSWPTRYTFKFVVPVAQLEALKSLLGVKSFDKETPSKTGKYVSATFIRQVESADAVVAVYESVAGIPGLVSL